jgi:hypothetical protein
MEREAIKPLRLEAMTLRGLGSYLHGGRLEIRPLTVLCGTNGSGKSTWFRMLELLRQSHESRELPFAFVDDIGCGEAFFHDYTNAFVNIETERRTLLVSLERDREFGPLGTIGLHVVADLDFDLDDAMDAARAEGPSEISFDPGSAAHAFLWAGRCARGTRFRLRMSHASSIDIDRWVPRCVELLIGEELVIRFEETTDRGRFEAMCSKSFWPGAEPGDHTEFEVASFAISNGRPRDIRGPDDQPAFDLQIGFCEVAVARIRQLLDQTLRGIFRLHAIRRIQRAGHLDETLDQGVIRERSVGHEGQDTHTLARVFAKNRMRFDGRGAGRIDYRYVFVPARFLEVLYWSGMPPVDPHAFEIWQTEREPLASKIWQGLDERTKKTIDELFYRVPGSSEVIRSISMIPLCEDLDTLLSELAKRILNDSLSRRDLYDPAFSEFLTADTRSLLDIGIDRLSEVDLERFNRHFIDAALSKHFPYSHPGIPFRHPGSVFDIYYGSWLRKLLGIVPHDSAEDCWSDRADPPSGFLLQFSPEHQGVARSTSVEDELNSMFFYDSPLFGKPGCSAAPVNMSSGFHQLAPMVVQAGLMRANEVLCIENPEVHLHPKLQLDVTEFLVHQARIGKMILVETHSDLVLRRIMRAILEEDIKQEAVRIHFTDVDVGSSLHKELGYASSRIQVIEIDERGQIQNWPTGFMDDDIRESRRLLDVMYGTPATSGNGEEAL